MAKGPRGERRPADVIGNAVHVMRIATGQIEGVSTDAAAVALGRMGGKAHAASMEAERDRQEGRQKPGGVNTLST